MSLEHKAIVVYGGQYGSEGKASAAEFWACRALDEGAWVTVIGENSPNSGHTCSHGATKNIPAAAYFASAILLGPDSVVDPAVLVKDWEATGRKPLFVHEHAALLDGQSKANEQDLVQRISSTGSGSGSARGAKFIQRRVGAVIKDNFQHPGIEVVNSRKWLDLVKEAYYTRSLVMECSQGAMLDPNFDLYPFCTSRSTSPRVAVERNGLGWIPWKFAGVYRTYPIRTGGPSGPTGGAEIAWKSLDQQPEIATVTKRVRRVFEFSASDFCQSVEITRPDLLMFTFLDYLGVKDLAETSDFQEWLEFYGIEETRRLPVYVSNKTGRFVEFTRPSGRPFSTT